jgi:putative ABC transport system permease protein
MERLFRDLRHALRQLRKSPGFTLTAVLTLAFGIGATTAIFSIVEGVLLRPLPFPGQDRLMVFGDRLEGAGEQMDTPAVPAPESVTYSRQVTSFSSAGAYQQTGYELSGIGEPASINASRLTAAIFQVLNVSPLMGRVFTPQEDEGKQQVAVISYAMWRSRFHGDADILGRKILLDRKPYQIIGVMPREFEFPLVPGQLNRSELWVPMSFTQAEMLQGASSWNFTMIGRLKPGVTLEQARQDGERTAQQIQRNFPAAFGSIRIHAAIVPLEEEVVGTARPLVRTLFLAVAVVLFIACANLAGLLLVRVIRRKREIAVRLALGARKSAILRQSLIETLTLSIAGGVLGLGLAAVALKTGVSLLPETLPRIASIQLDWQVIGFAFSLALLTGLLCGLAPAFAASRTGVNDALKEAGRTGTAGGEHARLRSALVVVELAVAMVLLTGAGLLLRSFEKLRRVDMGFRTDHMLTASYGLPHDHYSTQAAVDSFNSMLLLKLRQLPGVQAVGVTSTLPASGSLSFQGFVPEGYVPPKPNELNVSWSSQVFGDFFAAAGIPILRGRGFTEADRAGAPLVIIVNRTLAERYWPHQNPIGKRIKIGVAETHTPWMTVVGEIGDIKQNTADQETMAQIYGSAPQMKEVLAGFASPDMLTANGGSIVIRTSIPPEQTANALRSVVRSIDPQLPLTQIETMERVVTEGQAPRRFNTAVITSFAGVAVLLAILGIYGVIAFSAALRTKEMAIRLALGSDRAGIMYIVLSSGARLGLVGCAIGALGAVLFTRLMRTLLFEVDPLDPAVIVLAAVAIFLLALAASLLPARRAASIEPMQALRAE